MTDTNIQSNSGEASTFSLSEPFPLKVAVKAIFFWVIVMDFATGLVCLLGTLGKGYYGDDTALLLSVLGHIAQTTYFGLDLLERCLLSTAFINLAIALAFAPLVFCFSDKSRLKRDFGSIALCLALLLETFYVGWLISSGILIGRTQGSWQLTLELGAVGIGIVVPFCLLLLVLCTALFEAFRELKQKATTSIRYGFLLKHVLPILSGTAALLPGALIFFLLWRNEADHSALWAKSSEAAQIFEATDVTLISRPIVHPLKVVTESYLFTFDLELLLDSMKSSEVNPFSPYFVENGFDALIKDSIVEIISANDHDLKVQASLDEVFQEDFLHRSVTRGVVSVVDLKNGQPLRYLTLERMGPAGECGSTVRVKTPDGQSLNYWESVCYY